MKRFYETHNIDPITTRCWLDKVLEDQGLEYKDGEIVEILQESADAEIDVNRNEDGKIRKALISVLKSDFENDTTIDDISVGDIIVWLEKQGEQKLIDNLTPQEAMDIAVAKCFDKQKPIDKVEPKFHEGDWIIHQGTENIYQVVAVIDNQYQLKYGDNYTIQNCADVDRCARLWNIAKDAKDGDVLVDIYGNIGIYEKCDDFDWTSYCSLGHNGGFQHFIIEHENEKTYPATKEQHDLLFSKMHEAGYEWDSEKKILKEIEYPLPSFDEAQGTPIIKIDEKKRYVPNEVFKFYVELDFSLPEITVFTKPFPEANSIEEYESREKYVQEKYFTKECINKIKEILIKKIQENDNPFHITCTDRDSGYNVTEDELFKIN